MSTIQQLKNFIRHGKQALHGQHDDGLHKNQAVNLQSASHGSLEPETDRLTDYHIVQPPDAYQVQPADGRFNGEATYVGDYAVPQTKTKKRVDEKEIAKLVAEENESRSKFPRYPGLDRWIILEKMGDGAFSNVYRARDSQNQYGEVAIKVVRKYEMNGPQGNKHLHPDFKIGKAAERSNILKEVQIMRQLDHPNIVKLIDFSESKQYYYITLELAPGGELFHQIVRLTYFSEDLTRHVILQVAKALEYLHEEMGVVHRDIKPENILFIPIDFVPSQNPAHKQPGDEDKEDEGEFVPGRGAGGIGQVKIADFGLSKVVWDDQTMTPCGTVGYTAPEIVKDERYSKSVDMWALGCVLYTLLCGFPPFYDESIEVLTEKVARGQYTFLSPWWDGVSKSAQDLISHLLTVEPDKRYTIAEFLAHPWICASGPTPRDDRRSQSDIVEGWQSKNAADAPARYDFRSPGAVNLREVFDVGYAVHRQEEARRQQGRAKGAVISRYLGGLDEEDEDEFGEAAHSRQLAGIGMTSTLEQSMRKTSLRDQPDRQEHRGRDKERAPPPNPSDRGYGQHSAAVTAAARQQVRDTQRRRGEFELRLDGATLLSRRGAKPAGMVGGP